jgi:D-lactate dehydrogenase (cytochrome)
VVLPNAEVIKTRRRARKSAAGFDTTKLFIGAEGSLGIVTEGEFPSPFAKNELILAQLHYAWLPNYPHPLR